MTTKTFSGQTAQFISSVIVALPRNISGDDMQRIAENPAALQRKLRRALCGQMVNEWHPFYQNPAYMNEVQWRGFLTFIGIDSCQKIVLSCGIAPLNEGDYVIYFDEFGKYQSVNCGVLADYKNKYMPDYSDYRELWLTEEYRRLFEA